MKHLKAFEHFDDNMTDETCCPTCSSLNILNTNGQCECIDCGESFQDGESFAPEEDLLADEELNDIASEIDQDITSEVDADSEELAMMAEDEEDYLDDHVDDVMPPALTSDEVDTYNDDSAMISNIISQAAAVDQILADQLQYEADQIESFDEFQRVAIATIQDIDGCDREEATLKFEELMDSAANSTVVEKKTESRISKFNAFKG